MPDDVHTRRLPPLRVTMYTHTPLPLHFPSLPLSTPSLTPQPRPRLLNKNAQTRTAGDIAVSQRQRIAAMRRQEGTEWDRVWAGGRSSRRPERLPPALPLMTRRDRLACRRPPRGHRRPDSACGARTARPESNNVTAGVFRLYRPARLGELTFGQHVPPARRLA